MQGFTSWKIRHRSSSPLSHLNLTQCCLLLQLYKYCLNQWMANWSICNISEGCTASHHVIEKNQFLHQWALGPPFISSGRRSKTSPSDLSCQPARGSQGQRNLSRPLNTNGGLKQQEFLLCSDIISHPFIWVKMAYQWSREFRKSTSSSPYISECKRPQEMTLVLR